MICREFFRAASMFLLSEQMSMPKRLPALLFLSVFLFKCEIFKRTEILVN